MIDSQDGKPILACYQSNNIDNEVNPFQVQCINTCKDPKVDIALLPISTEGSCSNSELLVNPFAVTDRNISLNVSIGSDCNYEDNLFSIADSLYQLTIEKSIMNALECMKDLEGSPVQMINEDFESIADDCYYCAMNQAITSILYESLHEKGFLDIHYSHQNPSNVDIHDKKLLSSTIIRHESEVFLVTDRNQSIKLSVMQEETDNICVKRNRLNGDGESTYLENFSQEDYRLENSLIDEDSQISEGKVRLGHCESLVSERYDDFDHQGFPILTEVERYEDRHEDEFESSTTSFLLLSPSSRCDMTIPSSISLGGEHDGDRIGCSSTSITGSSSQHSKLSASASASAKLSSSKSNHSSQCSHSPSDLLRSKQSPTKYSKRKHSPSSDLKSSSSSTSSSLSSSLAAAATLPSSASPSSSSSQKKRTRSKERGKSSPSSESSMESSSSCLCSHDAIIPMPIIIDGSSQEQSEQEATMKLTENNQESSVRTTISSSSSSSVILHSEINCQLFTRPLLVSILVGTSLSPILITSMWKSLRTQDPDHILQDSSRLTMPIEAIFRVYDISTSHEGCLIITAKESLQRLYQWKDKYGCCVLEFFRPFELNWWIEHLVDVIQVHEKKNGDFTVSLKKPWIEKILKQQQSSIIMNTNSSNSSNSHVHVNRSHEDENTSVMEEGHPRDSHDPSIKKSKETRPVTTRVNRAISMEITTDPQGKPSPYLRIPALLSLSLSESLSLLSEDSSNLKSNQGKSRKAARNHEKVEVQSKDKDKEKEKEKEKEKDTMSHSNDKKSSTSAESTTRCNKASSSHSMKKSTAVATTTSLLSSTIPIPASSKPKSRLRIHQLQHQKELSQGSPSKPMENNDIDSSHGHAISIMESKEKEEEEEKIEEEIEELSEKHELMGKKESLLEEPSSTTATTTAADTTQKMVLSGMRKEEIVARAAIQRARDMTSGSWKFKNRALSPIEKRLFDSPFARISWRPTSPDGRTSREMQKLISLAENNMINTNGGEATNARSYRLRAGFV